MASPASTNVSELSRFSTIKPYEQRAIILRNDGQKWPDVQASLKAEFGKEGTFHFDTIRGWFAPGGRLEQANGEYLGALADQSLEEALKLARRASKAAIITMTELMGVSHDPGVRLNAAKALANKYVPDRQIVLGRGLEAEELPAELAAEGDEILDGGNNDGASDSGSAPEPTPEPAPADDAPEGAPVDQEAGTGEGEAVPESVLPEPAAPDGPSDPPA